MSDGSDDEATQEIYEHELEWPIYALGWSLRPEYPFRLAVGSFIEDYNNRVKIVQLEPSTGVWKERGEFVHPYPPTKVAWLPDDTGARPDLLATTGDYLRLWEVDETTGEVSQKCLLNNNKNPDFKYCAPLTSFDWNEQNLSMIATCSIDTTCTIWDIETQQAKTQVIAHDKEVYDVAFRTGHPDVFASVGADGSVRLFDLRSLEQSTIIYENPTPAPLLRLAWNKQDEHYLATVCMTSSSCIVLDTRFPSIPAAELTGHSGCLNSLAWAPHSSCHITTAGDDRQALIWDLKPLPAKIEDPILAYQAAGEVNQLQWSKAQPFWIGIGFGQTVQLLRV